MELLTRVVSENEYKGFYDHMKRDFPANERPPYLAMRNNLKKDFYTGIYISDNGVDIGYATIVAPNNSKFALITFLGIFPENRSKGYGGAVLSVIAEKWSDRILVLEVEDVNAAENEDEKTLRQRRIEFYKRAGYTMLETSVCKIFKVDMKIMVNSNKIEESAHQIMHEMYGAIFSNPFWLRNIDIKD